MRIRHRSDRALLICAATLLFGCATTEPITEAPELPDLAPTDVITSTDSLAIETDLVEPMHHEIVAIDLPTVLRVIATDNLEILQARQAVVEEQGRYDARVGSAVPTLSPGMLFEIVDGRTRATQGNIVDVGFNTFRIFIALDWVLNPGRTYYEIVAAKRRLAVTEHQQRAIVIETIHHAAVQYYELVLSQARVGAAKRALDEARELLRINDLRARSGTGIPADRLRAEARVAERRQELLIEMNRFYRASVTLAVTLRLDSAVTLIPSNEELYPTTLVRDDFTIDELTGLAVIFRPDLVAIRTLIEAVEADRSAQWWGGFGPTFQASYLIGGISGHSADGIDGLENKSGFGGYQLFSAGTGLRLSLSSLGSLRAAEAIEEKTRLGAERMLDSVKAQVVSALQSSRTNEQLIEMSRLQMDPAAQALRLTETGLRVGTMTMLDVLQAADDLARARLRFAEAVVGYNQSQIDLLAALGVLDQQALFPHERPEETEDG